MEHPERAAQFDDLVFESSLLVPTLGVVTHHSHDEIGPDLPRWVQQRHRERDRQSTAVAVQGRYLQEALAVVGDPRGHDRGIPGPVPSTKPFGDDEVERRADGFE